MSGLPVTLAAQRNPLYRRPARPYILDLPDEMLLRVVGFVEQADEEQAVGDAAVYRRSFNSVISLAWTNRRLRQVCREIIFRTVSILRIPDWPIEHCVGDYAKVAQYNFPVNHPEVLVFFHQPMVHILRHTTNLSFHQFWHAFGCTRLEDTCAMEMIAKGLRLMIEASKKLRRLHIDGEKYFAQYMRRELQSSPAARAALANLEEIVLSIEFDFMLQYTPNVSRLSNNTLMSRTTGASSDDLRSYSMTQVTRFFGLCSRLSRLTEMELNIDSFKSPAFSRAVLPTMRLQKLAVAREVVQCCEDYQVGRGFGDPIPLGVLLNMARSQPNLREFRIPETDLVMIGAFEVEIEWPLAGQILDMLPAAIIAAKVPTLRSIHVGQNVTVDVLHNGLGMRYLRMMSDNLEPVTRRDQRPRPRPGFPYQPFGSDLWIHKWDSWKEPVVARRRHWEARREIWAELPLHINYYGNFQHPAFIETAMDTNGKWKSIAVVVNMNHELIEMRDEGDIP